MRSLAIPFEWQEAVIRAAISLKLCTYEDTGAVLAALTTSIPESPGSGRNWDYRYCWLRDSYFVIQALNRLGATRTMEGYLRFIDRIVASCGDRDIAPLYSIVRRDARCPSGSCRRCAAIAAWGRCASATTPTCSGSTTSTARSSSPRRTRSSTSG